MIKRTLAAMVAIAFIPAPAFGMTAIAHRGADNKNVVENTIAALERAHKLDAWSETDVFMSKDRVPMIMHDSTLNRTTNCEGRVDSRTAKYIRNNCRTKNGDVVPTFKEYAKVLADNKGQRLDAEVKGPGWWWKPGAPGLVKLRNIVKNAGVIKRVYFSQDATIRTIEDLNTYASDTRICWKPSDSAMSIKEAKRLSADAVMIRPSYWTRERVAAVKNAGIKAWARQINTKDKWKRMKKIGITASLTDHPEWS